MSGSAKKGCCCERQPGPCPPDCLDCPGAFSIEITGLIIENQGVNYTYTCLATEGISPPPPDCVWNEPLIPVDITANGLTPSPQRPRLAQVGCTCGFEGDPDLCAWFATMTLFGGGGPPDDPVPGFAANYIFFVLEGQVCPPAAVYPNFSVSPVFGATVIDVGTCVVS